MRSFIIFTLLSFILGCSPKPAVVVATETSTQEPVEPADVGPCATWFDYDAGVRDEITTNHVLYVDAMKVGEFVAAKTYWEQAYAKAPAADGKRRSHFEDGIKIHHHFFTEAQSKRDKEHHIDQIMKIYEHMDQCFGEGGYVSGRMGFDYYYNYSDFISEDEIFELLRKSIDIDGLNTNYFVVNPFTSLLIKNFLEDKLALDEAQHYVSLLKDVILSSLANCQSETECESWKIVEEYSLSRFEELEGVRGFYGCEYYMEKNYALFEANPDSCEILREVYGSLRWGGCDVNDPMLVQIRDRLDQFCRVSREPGPLRLAYIALEEGNYSNAVDKLDEYVKSTDDPEKKARFTLLAAKVYYTHLKNFPEARRYALKAATFKDRWGEPYILIGKLYASSGPLCGPGRGWDSQVVTWAAIDKFEYAKRIDPAVAQEANHWINYYRQYMPSIEDIFSRLLKEGQTFRVPCWIQEDTVIRPAPKS